MSKDEKKKKNNDVKKNSFLSESRAELKKVNWPKPKELANDTATVIGITLIIAIIVVIFDSIFITANSKLVINTEQKIKNSTSVENVVETTDENNTSEETTEESSDSSSEETTSEETTSDETITTDSTETTSSDASVTENVNQ